MDELQQDIAAMRAITISREYGSGGGEIAARLAKRLGWRLIDHEVVAQVAHALGISPEEAAERDEQVEGFISRLLSGMRLSAPEILVTGSPPIAPQKLERAEHDVLHRIVEEAANEGHVVIVGRGGQVILAERRDTLHVRIIAPLDARVTYVARREQLSPSAARARVQMKDRARARYMQTLYHCQHTDPHLYDLVINTAILDIDSAVDLICLALARKARRLTVPATELGPAAGLTQYPGQPADFPLSPQA